MRLQSPKHSRPAQPHNIQVPAHTSATRPDMVTQPSVFINHGGGPLPLLAGKQPAVTTVLRKYASTLEQRPKAILIIDAHWEGEVVSVSDARQHTKLVFDYVGFQPESYQYTYQPPGDESVARRVVELLPLFVCAGAGEGMPP